MALQWAKWPAGLRRYATQARLQLTNLVSNLGEGSGILTLGWGWAHAACRGIIAGTAVAGDSGKMSCVMWASSGLNSFCCQERQALKLKMLEALLCHIAGRLTVGGRL